MELVDPKLEGQPELPGMPEPDPSPTFEGAYVFGNDYKIKQGASSLLWCPGEMRPDPETGEMLRWRPIFREEIPMGTELRLEATARVVGVNYKRDGKGLLHREHTLEVTDVVVDLGD